MRMLLMETEESWPDDARKRYHRILVGWLPRTSSGGGRLEFVRARRWGSSTVRRVHKSLLVQSEAEVSAGMEWISIVA